MKPIELKKYKKADVYMGPLGGLYAKVGDRLYKLVNVKPMYGVKVKTKKK